MPANSRIVVIGTSAGGPDALRRLFKRLPADFPAPVLVVMHVGSRYSIMPRILERDANLPVRHAVDAEPVSSGVVLMAPPDRHLLVEDGIVRVTRGPKENFSRPAIDPLFRSAAMHYRENAIGVILTGLLDDGTIGLQAIKAYGGSALVQDPLDADEPAMPRSAINHVQVDACLPVEELGDHLVELAGSVPKQISPNLYSHPVEVQGRFDLRQKTDMQELNEIAIPSGLTCPECHGSLWEIKGSNPPNFRCHTGHMYTAQGLNSLQDAVVEEAIWAAVRALHEKQMLLQRLAASAEAAKQTTAFDEHVATAEGVARHAEILRRIISRGPES